MTKPQLNVYHLDKWVFYFPLEKSVIQIGRSSSNDLILHGETISRRHALIKFQNAAWLVEDLSTVGTVVNGTKLDGKMILKDQTEIVIENWRIVFQLEETQPQTNDEQTVIQAESAGETTHVLESSDQGQRIKVSKPVLIIEETSGRRKYDVRRKAILVGTSPECDVVVSDAYVSKMHLEMRMSDRGFHVRDLGSTNGSFVGDTRISETYLKSDETLRIGTSNIHVCFETVEHVDVEPWAEANFSGICGGSEPMRTLFSKVRLVAQTDYTVLVQGETGTGKELIARAIHDNSLRREQPFVVINCAAIQTNLAESELFGHEKGAFTGADQRFKGVFEQADTGTLFLDEVGELSLEMQSKILRVLEYQTLRRVGGSEEIRADVRVVAATHRDLARMVEEGTFREDLYYRLMILPLEIPSLRERMDDIRVLSEMFLKMHSGSRRLMFTENALAKLQGHTWPGNVRELRNTILRTVTLAASEVLDADDILFIHRPVTPGLIESQVSPSAKDMIQKRLEEQKALERNQIVSALVEAAGDKLQAAEKLGVARSTLFRKIKEYGIQT